MSRLDGWLYHAATLSVFSDALVVEVRFCSDAICREALSDRSRS